MPRQEIAATVVGGAGSDVVFVHAHEQGARSCVGNIATHRAYPPSVGRDRRDHDAERVLPTGGAAWPAPRLASGVWRSTLHRTLTAATVFTGGTHAGEDRFQEDTRLLRG